MRGLTGMGPGQRHNVEVTPDDANWMRFVSIAFVVFGGVAFIIVPNLLMAKKWPYWRREHAAVSALAGMLWYITFFLLLAIGCSIILFTTGSLLPASGMVPLDGSDPAGLAFFLMMVTFQLTFVSVPVIQALIGPSRRHKARRVYFLVPARLERWYLRKVGAPNWPGAPASS